MEYAENGNLKNFIKIHKILDRNIEEKKIAKINYQAISVIVFLQETGFQHKYISTSNIFLTKDDDIKIGGLEYLAKTVNNIELKPNEYEISYFIQNKSFKDDMYSLGIVFYNLKNLIPKYIVFPQNFKEYKESIEKEVKDENSPEKYMLEKKEENNLEKIKEMIINNYNNYCLKNLNTSIKSVYYCLNYLFYHPEIEMEKIQLRIINKNFFRSDGPITQSIKENNLIKIRKMLIQKNKLFGLPGEIHPSELIKCIIKELYLENNILNNNEFMKENGFCGKYAIQDICDECKNNIYYQENFYYITLDLDEDTDNSIPCKNQNNSGKREFLGKEFKDEIVTYKYCNNCNKVTKHKETKCILKLPCRLVILIKNNSKKDLNITKTFRNQKYFIVATINYNIEDNEYEYSYFQYNNESQTYINNNNEKHGNINLKNLTALFCLYVG